jgi:excinuclease UvrABC nuclease subunit
MTEVESLEEILKHEDGWRTPNSYSHHYAPIPNGSGVYILGGSINKTYCEDKKEKVLYVGMSTILCNRIRGHSVIKEIEEINMYVRVFFKSYHSSIIRKEEGELIKKYNPPYNIIGKIRGI